MLERDSLRFRLDDSRIAANDTEVAPGWNVRIHAEATPLVQFMRLREQFDSVSTLREQFGIDAPLPPLTLLILPLTDTLLNSVGVEWSRSPQMATLWYTRRLLVSPVTADGGIDPHELAHLVHPNDRPINPLFAEAFAVALGGTMGRSVGEEVCALRDDASYSTRIAEISPPNLLDGFDHISKLVLSTVLRDVLPSLDDKRAVFDPRYWQPRANPWRDLSLLTKRPTDVLLQQGVDNLRRILSKCSS